MKTKLNKKSLAAGLAAVVLSTGAFLGASLLVSQDAEAQMANCYATENGQVTMICKASTKYNCTVEVSGADDEGKITTVAMHCLGDPLK